MITKSATNVNLGAVAGWFLCWKKGDLKLQKAMALNCSVFLSRD